MISAVAIAISLLAIGIKGLNLGIDFKGGTQITFTMPADSPVAIDDVRDRPTTIGHGDAQIVRAAATAVDGKYTSFQIRPRSSRPSRRRR